MDRERGRSRPQTTCKAWMLRKTESGKQFANNQIVNKKERDDMAVDFSRPSVRDALAGRARREAGKRGMSRCWLECR